MIKKTLRIIIIRFRIAKIILRIREVKARRTRKKDSRRIKTNKNIRRAIKRNLNIVIIIKRKSRKRKIIIRRKAFNYIKWKWKY